MKNILKVPAQLIALTLVLFQTSGYGNIQKPEIPGTPASKLTLEEVRQMFKKERKVYLLDVKRDVKDLQLRIKLRRLI